MSHISGFEQLERQMRALENAAAKRLDEAIPEVGEEMRQDMVTHVRRRTGHLAEVMQRDDFVKKFQSRRNGVSVEVGFRTSEIRREARYAFYLEFGTKRNETGGRRFAGKKNGRDRMKRVKRGNPARPAHPFYRPAYARMIENMRQRRQRAWAMALTDAVSETIGR